MEHLMEETPKPPYQGLATQYLYLNQLFYLFADG